MAVKSKPGNKAGKPIKSILKTKPVQKKAAPAPNSSESESEDSEDFKKSAKLSFSSEEEEEDSSEDDLNDMGDDMDDMDDMDDDFGASDSDVMDSDNENEEEPTKRTQEPPSKVKPEPNHSDFGKALSSILNSRVKAYNVDNPVLVRDQRSAKQIVKDKEDAKARKALRADKLKLKDKARVKDVIPKDPELAGDRLQKEKALRKMAQRGVVRLLNAIHSAQSAAVNGLEDTEVSKEKFLDMIRMG